MLLKNPTVPLDLSAKASSNHISGELHSITDGSSAIFCLTKGPFFLKDLVVTNDMTGAVMVINQDYKAIQLYLRASDAAGKSVYCCVQVLDTAIARVRVSYRVIGGKYQSMLPVLLEMRDQMTPSWLPTMPFSQLLNVPATLPPADHTHPFSDITGIERVFPALYHILTNLFISQKSQYTDIYAYMEAKLVAKAAQVMLKLVDLGQNIDVMENAFRLGHLDIRFTDEPNPPSNILGYGHWTLMDPAIVYGASPSDTIGSTFGLANGTMPNALNSRRTYMWQLNDEDVDFRIIVTANKTRVNEGDSITFTVVSPGRGQGTAFPWHITGLEAQDIVGGVVSGTMILDSAGSASLTFNIVADVLSDPGEYIRFNLDQYPLRFSQIPITDTSPNPSISAWFAQNSSGTQHITVATEGMIVYLIVKTTNILPGTTLYVAYDGTTVKSTQILAVLPTTVTTDADGFLAIPITIAVDHITDGRTNLIAWVGQIAGVANATIAARMRIKDTSKYPTFNTALSSNTAGTLQITSVNENGKFYLNVWTSDIDEGAQLPLSYGGNSNDSDFTSTLPAFVTIVGNHGRVEFDLRADTLSESREELLIAMSYNGEVVANEHIYINDTSFTGSAHCQFSTNTTATNLITDLNEGDGVYFVAQISGYANGTVLPLVYDGPLLQNRFSGGMPSTITINNNTANIRFNLLNDATTEGDAYFGITVMDPAGNNALCRASILTHDTSKSPTYTVQLMSDQNGTLPITECNEGDVIYAFVSAENLPLITVLGIDVTVNGIKATVANGQLIANPAINVTLVNGIGSIAIKTKADHRTEGDGALQVKIRASSSPTDTVVASQSIILRDTSRSPTIACKFSSLPDGSDTITGHGVLHNQTVYLVVTSSNVIPGTTYWMNYANAAANPASQADVLTVLPDYVVIQDNVQIYPWVIKENFVPGSVNGAISILKVNFFSDALMTRPVMNTNIQIIDPAFQMKFSALSSGVNSVTQCNEGDTVYLVMNSAHVIDASALSLRWLIDGVVVTGQNSDFVQSITNAFTVTNNLFILPVTIDVDNIPDGSKRLQIQLYGSTFSDGDAPLAVANLLMVDTSFGGVTSLGTYGTGSIGTLSIPALGTRLVTLTGSGASGALGAVDDPDVPASEGFDGEPTTLTYGANVLYTVGGGKAGHRDGTGGQGGVITSNQTAITNAAAVFSISAVVNTLGHNAPTGVSTGATSANTNGTGAGSNGNLATTGGGSGAVLTFRVTNTTNAALALTVNVGHGGLDVQGLTPQSWNDGSIVVAS